MKFSGFTFLLLLYLFGIVSCEKEKVTDTPFVRQQPSLSDNLKSLKVKAYAGQDVVLSLPTNKVKLYGSLSLWEYDLKDIVLKWKKMIGPNSYQLDSSNTLDPILSELEKGEYWLELTATNPAGFYDIDTTIVFVNDTTAGLNKEKVFNNLEWTFPWYPTLVIPDIYSFMPVGTSIRVFIQPYGNSDWIEVGPFSTDPYCTCSYQYIIESRPDGAGMYKFSSINIFNYDNIADYNQKPNVKIKY
ncbi:MAG: PKD domain-containing protein [Chitinophagaceae bacterium]